MHNKDGKLGAVSFAFRFWERLQFFLDILLEFRKGIPVNRFNINRENHLSRWYLLESFSRIIDFIL